MKLSLHANGKNEHITTLTEAAEQEIVTIKANTALSPEEKATRITAVKDKLARERKEAVRKLF